MGTQQGDKTDPSIINNAATQIVESIVHIDTKRKASKHEAGVSARSSSIGGRPSF